MKHTALPWETTPTGSHIFSNTGKGHDGVICKMSHAGPLQWAAEPASLENTANAEFIVRACNSHDELVELWHMTLKAAQSITTKYTLSDFHKDIERYAKLALAKATK